MASFLLTVETDDSRDITPHLISTGIHWRVSVVSDFWRNDIYPYGFPFHSAVLFPVLLNSVSLCVPRYHRISLVSCVTLTSCLVFQIE
jgi:hypothetical protein